MHRMTALIATAAMVALLGGTMAYIVLQRASDPLADCRNGTAAGDLGGAFTLTDPSGARVTEATLFDRPTLVYFGYGSCPDICPLDNARNAAAVDILAERGMEVQPVFVSVDPARDTPEVLQALAENLHPEMRALTGSPDEVREAAEAFRVVYRLEPPDADGFYLVSHTSFTYLMLPDTGFADFFRRDASPDDVAEQTACFIQALA